nr:FAD-dependent monooxygenase [Pseudonocardia sp. HH130629-09]
MHVLIVGGGIGGLTTALALERAGIGSTVLEQGSGAGELGVGFNLLPHAVRVLDGLGLSAEPAEVGSRPPTSPTPTGSAGRSCAGPAGWRPGSRSRRSPGTAAGCTGCSPTPCAHGWGPTRSVPGTGSTASSGPRTASGAGSPTTRCPP